MKVWQRSKDFAVFIYRISNEEPFSKDYGLRDQMRRAGVSIPSNIAEGDELKTNKQSIQFFFMAKGSVAELVTQALIAFEIGHINQENYNYIRNECQAISSMLTKLIKARSKI
ncbi:MAG: four helix bundle protein [Deltaproteobacteria bacterium]|nr:four helix bundle protein [Deltaproteobacteria bacterium]